MPDIKGYSKELYDEYVLAEEHVKEILLVRLSKFGVTQPYVQVNNDTIYIEAPGTGNIKRLRSVNQSTAVLDFHKVYTFNEVYGLIAEIEKPLLSA